MRYMKLLGLEMMVFAIGATVLFGQGNQEAANLTREGIEASKTKSAQTLQMNRKYCSEKTFSKRDYTHHRHHRQRHPVPFLILTCVRQPQRLQHRLTSPKQGTALDCPEM